MDIIENASKQAKPKPTSEFVLARVELIKTFDMAAEWATTKYPQTISDAIKNVFKRIRRNEHKHFVTISNDAVISFAKDVTKPFGTRRVQTSLGRYIRRQLNVTTNDISDQVMDAVCNKINAHVKFDKRLEQIKVLRGKDITAYYRDNTNFGSCLVGSQAFRTEIYAMNPDKVGLVVFENKARTLIWVDDNGVKLIDRPYYNDHVASELLTLWGQSNDHVSIASGGIHYVTLKYGKYMPSIDTLYCFLFDKDAKTVKISNGNMPGCVHSSYELAYTPGNKVYKCEMQYCGKFAPDEPENNFGSKWYCDTCIAKVVKPCKHCKKLISSTCKEVLCESCVAEFGRKCYNVNCITRKEQKVFYKPEMIKMKRPGEKRVCFACCPDCMKAINPDWQEK